MKIISTFAYNPKNLNAQKQTKNISKLSFGSKEGDKEKMNKESVLLNGSVTRNYFEYPNHPDYSHYECNERILSKSAKDLEGLALTVIGIDDELIRDYYSSEYNPIIKTRSKHKSQKAYEKFAPIVEQKRKEYNTAKREYAEALDTFNQFPCDETEELCRQKYEKLKEFVECANNDFKATVISIPWEIYYESERTDIDERIDFRLMY